MEKWTLWLALEAATVMTIASLWLLWRGFALRKKLSLDDEGPATTENNNNQQDELDTPYQALADELEAQASKAVDKLKALRGSDDMTAITQYKVWGTLAKAESSILVNEATDDPKPILHNFMASIVGALESVQSRGLNHHTLTQNIKDLDAEFIQASELLISKEELIANQKDLHNELRKSIERATIKITQMTKKSQEFQRLTRELKKLQGQVKELEADEGANKLMSHSSKSDNYVESDKHHSTRHLQQLDRLSQRQQAIIENLQGQLEDEDKEKESENEQAREQALSRMERLAQESHSLIEQLQNELDSTNLTISALRDDISLKEAQLKDLNKQLKAAEGGVLGGFQTLSSNKRNTLEAIIGEIETFRQGDNSQPDSLLNQEKEVSNLEQILKESETCVQLLVQEVESAEAENEKLRVEVEAKAKNKEKSAIAEANENSGPLAELNNLRDQNRLLASEVQDLQETLVSQVSNTSAKALRNEYNKKSLELDRLQLAYSDLERKYLGTLR